MLDADEVRRLEGTVASLTEEAGRRAQAEVSKVKDDYNTNIKKMSQEVAKLEMVRQNLVSSFSKSSLLGCVFIGNPSRLWP